MNKAEREHLDRVAQLGCVICGAEAEIHHIKAGRYSQRKASNFHVLPLCHRHHRTGGLGVAVEAGMKSWAWDELKLLEEVQRRLKVLEANTI